MGIDRRIIIKQILWKWDVTAYTELIYYGQNQVLDSCKYGNETSESIECREFPDQLRNY